jgi:hypothetical protein
MLDQKLGLPDLYRRSGHQAWMYLTLGMQIREQWSGNGKSELFSRCGNAWCIPAPAVGHKVQPAVLLPSEMGTMVSSLHDANSAGDYNPLYCMANRNETFTIYARGYRFERSWLERGDPYFVSVDGALVNMTAVERIQYDKDRLNGKFGGLPLTADPPSPACQASSPASPLQKEL